MTGTEKAKIVNYYGRLEERSDRALSMMDKFYKKGDMEKFRRTKTRLDEISAEKEGIRNTLKLLGYTITVD